MSIQKPEFKRGQKARFMYKCFESPESCDAELWCHTNQLVIIIRELSNKEIDRRDIGRMYRVKFSDGFEYDVFEEELSNVTFTQQSRHETRR
jgi:hypothetical protein